MNHLGRKGAALLVSLGLCLMMAGCGESRSQFAGTYRSEAPFAGKGHIEMILKENGESTWTFDQNTLKFKWKVEDGRLWLYTREGAILIATPSEGGQQLSVDLSGDWHPSCPVDRCLIFKRVPGGGS
jgi:hypothetical protein